MAPFLQAILIATPAAFLASHVSSMAYVEDTTPLPAYPTNGIPSGPPEPPLCLDWPPITQRVAFHVLTKTDGTGNIPMGILQAQVDTLNRAFSGEDAKAKKYRTPTDSGIRFVLDSIDYTQNDEWYDNCALWNYQPIIKKALFVNGTYNVYTCNVAANLGLSIIPYAQTKIYNDTSPATPLPEDHWYLGTMLDSGLLPGSKVFKGRWSQGLILVHEAGHHYGLNHLYQGGCLYDETASDNIADTPRQNGNPSESCASLKGHRSCHHKKVYDDNSNYMSINYDSCRSHFTPGQVSYMRHIIAAYKPVLAEGGYDEDYDYEGL